MLQDVVPLYWLFVDMYDFVAWLFCFCLFVCLFFPIPSIVTEAASHKRKVHCSCTLKFGDPALKTSLVIVTSSP